MRAITAADRIVSPPRAELDVLRQPLTAGERAVFEFFDTHLHPKWEIYIQPHLNGLRPDFVLLNPEVGIAVFEVKDWNLDAMEYFVPHTSQPALWGRKGGEEFSLEAQNPFSKVSQYREAIYNLYCPRLKNKAGFAAITAGVIFPFASSGRVRKLFAAWLPQDQATANYQPVSGGAELAGGHLAKVFPEALRERSWLMREDLASDLRGWLEEPHFSKTQRQPLRLDASQRALASTRTASGYRRIKGAAGSGKSLVLAARAARLADEGKSVLLATFNITLWHYLRDLVVRGLATPANHRNIIFCNFHSWCGQVCKDVGWATAYENLWKDADPRRVLEEYLPRLVARAASAKGARKFDAILVDEGQDYRPLWWSTLRKFLNKGGEMVLAADATQDVYGTAGGWTEDAMKGAGFHGDWAQLEVSYRLPPSTVPHLREFASRFLPNESADVPVPRQGGLDLNSAHLRWVQCDEDNAVRASVVELRRMMRGTGAGVLANADITFLSADAAFGAEVCEWLDERLDIRSVSTFDPDTRERRREKMGFYMGDARIKATTLHSFKGWESPLLVVAIDGNTAEHAKALIYTGLTRLKHRAGGSRLTVVCSAAEMREYGQTWPEFVEF